MKTYTASYYGKINFIILLFLLLCMCKFCFAEHVVPNKCENQLREQYHECLEAIKWCGTDAGMCASNIFGLITGACVITSIGCGVQSAVCFHKLDNYQRCCNGLKADPVIGFTKQMLWNAAKCNTCTSNNDSMKSVCNVPSPKKKKNTK